MVFRDLEDRVLWTLTKSGVFFIKSFYECFRVKCCSPFSEEYHLDSVQSPQGRFLSLRKWREARP